MIFNAVCGNDDDHVRNHAVVYRHEEKRWRLSPAFDVVPNAVETPTRLVMQLSLGSWESGRAAVLEDASQFGFGSRLDADQHLEGMLMAIEGAFDAGTGELDADWRQVLRQRMVQTVQRLRSA